MELAGLPVIVSHYCPDGRMRREQFRTPRSRRRRIRRKWSRRETNWRSVLEEREVFKMANRWVCSPSTWEHLRELHGP